MKRRRGVFIEVLGRGRGREMGRAGGGEEMLGRAVALRTVEIFSEGMVYGFDLFRDGDI